MHALEDDDGDEDDDPEDMGDDNSDGDDAPNVNDEGHSEVRTRLVVAGSCIIHSIMKKKCQFAYWHAMKSPSVCKSSQTRIKLFQVS